MSIEKASDSTPNANGTFLPSDPGTVYGPHQMQVNGPENFFVNTISGVSFSRFQIPDPVATPNDSFVTVFNAGNGFTFTPVRKIGAEYVLGVFFDDDPNCIIFRVEDSALSTKQAFFQGKSFRKLRFREMTSSNIGVVDMLITVFTMQGSSPQISIG